MSHSVIGYLIGTSALSLLLGGVFALATSTIAIAQPERRPVRVARRRV